MWVFVFCVCDIFSLITKSPQRASEYDNVHITLTLTSLPCSDRRISYIMCEMHSMASVYIIPFTCKYFELHVGSCVMMLFDLLIRIIFLVLVTSCTSRFDILHHLYNIHVHLYRYIHFRTCTLHYASYRFLLESNSHPALVNNEGDTPFDLAEDSDEISTMISTYIETNNIDVDAAKNLEEAKMLEDVNRCVRVGGCGCAEEVF